ncbi:MAG: alanine racemase [Candidatus Falkowbacteria bacterium]|nr:alanine racemase [Candidatus Falkowbacteria bacterium]
MNKILKDKPKVKRGNLISVVKETLKNKEKLLAFCKNKKTPFYLLDEKKLDQSLSEFKKAFKIIAKSYYFYTIKTNYHPFILKKVVEAGFGLDVSSVRELEFALKTKAKKVLFSGPGKKQTDFELVFKNYKKIIVNIDSFGELKKLGEMAQKKKIKIEAGIRISPVNQDWSKFGIKLDRLRDFFNEAKQYEFISLVGVQIHSSWNEDAAPYEKNIKALALYLKNNFSSEELKKIKFVDLGGGFLVKESEGYYPDSLPQGRLKMLINNYFNEKTVFEDDYFMAEALSCEAYAQKINQAIKQNLKPILSCDYFFEPGRIIANPCMQLVFRVVDVKDKSNIIVDGGIHMVGWERFEEEYFPVINLSNPSLTEKKINIFGSLCTPYDILGYFCYTEEIKENDLLIIPNQGAYTYSLAQNFIHSIPPVYVFNI